MHRIWRLVWLFTFAAMLGFMLESLESFLSTGQVQNRQGMLFGPFTPVYGGGAVIFALLSPLVKNLSTASTFWAAAVTGTAVEYLWSVAQERLFGVVFWNYNHLPFQLHGRVNLLFSLFWGLLGLVFWRWVWPWFQKAYDSLPRSNTAWLGLALALLLTGTALWSSAVLLRYDQRRHAVAAYSPLSAYLDRIWPDEALAAHFPAMRLPPSGQ